MVRRRGVAGLVVGWFDGWAGWLSVKSQKWCSMAALYTLLAKTSTLVVNHLALV
jgi:hypothetical protein